MQKKYLMGNEAIAFGAVASGVNLVCGYPGTPSTEVLETIAKFKFKNIYVEWSINEKTAMEIAAGASYSGARTLVTMKQMGLNVASDPLMCVEYIGVKGGMVVLVADDPGPISSQTEQDTRKFAEFSKVPCFDPSSVKEAYEMIQDAFEFSERYCTPVFLRTTTRISHGYASINVKDPEEYKINTPEGFIKDSKRWVIFPKLSYLNHKKIFSRNVELSDVFSEYKRNSIIYAEHENNKRLGIATGGISFGYVFEALKNKNINDQLNSVFKVATPYPFPEKLAVKFLKNLDEVICIEELDPVIEEALLLICGKHGLKTKIYGKISNHVQTAGENTRDSVQKVINEFLKLPDADSTQKISIELPIRPPVLCAGCPHRASFYAVKQAMKNNKTIYCGDIGCYTLGNSMPLDMVDTCLCMGAGLGIAQGVYHIEPDTKCFAFVGDSTFFASAVTGIINAVYNQTEMTLIILDNSTTAMTGHQPHPGTGRTVMGEIVQKIDIEKILRGIGLKAVETVNPLEHKKSVETVKKVSDEPGVKAIIFKYPCIAINKKLNSMSVNYKKCIGCHRCVNEIGCPALFYENGSGKFSKVLIESSQCTGCTLCAQICPAGAIVSTEEEKK